ncbi:CopG family transcriptional regulator [Sphingomonas sp. AX6]|uniref:CopG family transcriptional regulator n=1 Tax=Sphingomonas sp. AX6 TaxID=2653171 RepID=UPI0012EFF826|nr:CopG family transcriptional regulator [Sphingomonas sp. AX6]VXC78542.1 CopG family transcriptional regulator [Sphingomonas sp. AX6]
MDNVREHRRASADSEKITINLGFVDLGHIDLLVRDGFYSNRTDFIRTAIRSQIARHSDEAGKAVRRAELDLGISHFDRSRLEGIEASGDMLDIRVLGLASIAEDVSPELARKTIRSLTVLGALHASAAVKAALADRLA